MAGTVSDILDGVLARKFGVSTPALRRYDSITDVIYYLFLLVAVWLLCGEVVSREWWAIALILFSEIAVVAVCFVKFGKYPSAHSWGAKFYGLCLLVCLVALLAFGAGGWALIGLSIVALLANFEITAMHLLANSPPVDASSIFQVLKK